MTDMTDTLDRAAIRAVVQQISEELDAHPIGRNEAFLVTADDPAPRRMTQTEVADLFADQRAVSKRLRRVLIPRGAALFVFVEDDVRVGVIRLDNLELSAEPDTLPAGACAVGVLGLLGGGR